MTGKRGGEYVLGPEASRQVAERLKKLMEERGLSQKRIERMTGGDVKQPHLSAYLAGRLNFTQKAISAISDALGVAERELVPDSVPVPVREQAAVGAPSDLLALSEDGKVPEGLAAFIERHDEKLKLTRQERWLLVNARFRVDKWMKMDDAFWAELLEFWRRYLREQQS